MLLIIPVRVLSRTDRDRPRSHRTTFYLIWQNKGNQQPRTRAHKRTDGPQSTNRRIFPIERITHPRTIKISQYDSPLNLRSTLVVYIVPARGGLQWSSKGHHIQFSLWPFLRRSYHCIRCTLARQARGISTSLIRILRAQTLTESSF